ncbi:MAG: LysR family transcriptional regulator [Gammaproteobacteria bacterium]|nr:MAG: LysR family transcriptional regulator [Gammaproteobacteria bacterium]
MPPEGKFATFGGMDIEHLRTFLEVSRTRHFGKAAENLYVTQSAVSARIRSLESALGVELFMRKRHDLQLTSSGNRLISHAETIVGAWTRARQEAGLAPQYDEILVIGGLYDLWPVLLDRWLPALTGTLPGVVVSAEAYSSDVLVKRLVDGLVDLGILFEPPRVSDLSTREVCVLDLVLMTNRQGLSAKQAMSEGFISIDWGQSFSHELTQRFPDIPTSSIRAGHGMIGYSFLTQRGGAAFLPATMVEKDIASGTLYPVDDAPVFQRPVYALYHSTSTRENTIKEAISLLAQKAI